MKILLFGGSGQLGFEIIKRANDLNFEIISPVTSEMDISEEKQVRFLAKQVQPDIIFNCAAYTAVDKAEEDIERCYQINRDGARNAALAAKDVSTRLIHISTDYVFEGNKHSALSEDEETGPLNQYGKSKLAGEAEIMKFYPDKSLILRTSSLYGQKGVNFVRTMLELFRTKELVKVVNDQFMSPTWAGWLAEVMLDLSRIKASGIVHACCKGETNWFEFAGLILEEARGKLNPKENLELAPIPASDYARPAKRPAYSVMDCSKLAKLLGREPISWQEGLRFHLSEIGMR
jgi:dTDP-4-dehydrorhamnose reductase